MRVRDHDRLHSQSMPFEHTRNAIDLVPRIDHDRLMRSVIAKDRAVALQNPYRQDFVDHEPAFRAFMIAEFSASTTGAAARNRRINSGRSLGVVAIFTSSSCQ